MQHFKKLAGAFTGLCMFVGASAHAALPTPATTAFTDLGTAIDDVEAAVWPVIGAAIVAFTIIKLVKRGAGKV